MEQNLKHDLHILHSAVAAVSQAPVLQKVQTAERAVAQLVRVVSNQTDVLIEMDQRIRVLESR